MTSSTRKRVILRLTARRGDRTFQAGFAEPAALRQPHRLELLLPEGETLTLAPGEWSAAYFVADFSADTLNHFPDPTSDPGARMHRGPAAGVRLRCRLLDHQNIDGMLASDLLHLEEGIELTPPHGGSLWTRVYVPRRALDQLSVVEVVRPPRRRRPAAADQFSLFSAEAAREQLPGGAA
ncbi:MAG: DUF6982 domain-containing protein [Terriglobales bacterium]